MLDSTHVDIDGIHYRNPAGNRGVLLLLLLLLKFDHRKKRIG